VIVGVHISILGSRTVKKGAGIAQSVWQLGYKLDDRRIKIQFPAETTYFSPLHNFQTGSESHPDSYPEGTRGGSPGVDLTAHLQLVMRLRMTDS
jgi:hypothetical protein